MEIDDSLYSRQRYMLGDHAMKALMHSHVILIHCGGVGIEIAKNLVLTGVQSLTIVDDTLATTNDLADNFYITENDISTKRQRSSICSEKLVELNPYVKVLTLPESYIDLNSIPATQKIFSQYNCVVATECKLEDQVKMDSVCRSITPTVKFIACDVLGLFASLFCDFGPEFHVHDPTGEEVEDVYISAITQESRGTVICHDARPHGFSDGDRVVFSDVEGMNELNCQVHSVQVTSPHMFTIGDTSKYSAYVRNGIVRVVGEEKTMNFRPLSEQLLQPSLVVTDFGKMETPSAIHLTYRAVHVYRAIHPDVWNDQSAAEVLDIARDLDPGLAAAQRDVILALAKASYGCMPPLCGVVGGLAAQEVLKAVTGKYTPLDQWLYLDALALLPPQNATSTSPALKNNGRYDRLRACVGPVLLSRLHRAKAFMVGCGAIGCEMLKNFALLGMSTEGRITVTDNDFVEKSNLNRQFLFRSHHIQKSKSEVAARAVKELNPDLKIVAMQKAVGAETEHSHFDDDFFQEQDLVVNALDNVEARRFMDSRCVSNRKALIESGTLGPKGHVQVVVPHLTESYSSQYDPNEEMVAFCTLRQFPTKPEHAIEWAKEKFDVQFTQRPEVFNKVLTDYVRANKSDDITLFRFLADNFDQYSHEVDDVVRVLTQWPTSWPDCVAKSRAVFEKYFNHKPRRLLAALPLDAKEQDGSPFWTLPKRPPTPLDFNKADPMHLQFITSRALLQAQIYRVKVPASGSPEYESGVEEGLRNAKLPELKIANVEVSALLDETEAARPACAGTSQSKLCHLADDHSKNTIRLRALVPQRFEKDDDSNGHVDYVTATSSLRAVMYGLTPYDRLQTKKVAGHIVPAISTTTSVVAGLATLQLLQVLKHQTTGDEGLSQFRNTFLNCGLPLLVFSEPAPAKRTTLASGLTHTLWDRWDVTGHAAFTLADFMQRVRDLSRLDVVSVSCGVKPIYLDFMPGHRQRLPRLMTELIASPPCGYVELLVCLQSDDITDDVYDDDLVAPAVRYYFNVSSQ